MPTTPTWIGLSPTDPSNNQATCNDVNPRTFTIYWAAASGSLDHYEVRESNHVNSNEEIITVSGAGNPPTVPTYLSLTRSKIPPDNATTYWYEVRACNVSGGDAGCSGWRGTAEMCVGKPSDDLPPPPPPPFRAVSTTYYHTDALGSPVAETNSSGVVIKRLRYEPYGLPADGTFPDAPGYTGHVADSFTQLSYMQQRYFDPITGRFLSVDPVAVDGGSGSNFNRYWYANNNPYRYIDPDGRQSRENMGRVSTGVPFFDWLINPSDLRGGQKQMIEKQFAFEYSQPRSAKDVAVLVGVAMSAGSLGIGRGPLAGTVVRATSIADDALVVRAGSGLGKGANTVEGLRAGTSTHPTVLVRGFSAESANGATVCELCSNMPKHYKQVGVTTAREIRAAGGDVISTPGQSPTHVTVTGLSPETANSLLTPTVDNPVPKPIQ